MKILVVNGPNLNMLGRREKGIYGDVTLDSICEQMRALADGRCELEFFQSNHEGDIIDMIHRTDASGIIINAGAYTHTSIAIRDALLSVSLPIVEVHLSNVYARESFRHKSYISDIAKGVIAGFGAKSYLLALDWFLGELA
ncbi:type II 3-dehydroquinate dehydratase [Seleniivibrio woodruffii]|uniref:3-dehydroquinate dehydratase n=1 Tax=Seleniivibrio woodruffii TaxID=1078050 RepID=A0A4R1KC68_9BACT|nr:type II 3-dehydroquinate dehydratase [Seleniivibrio woodruffii]TCK62074.1 3-dehydroquinate dehydratase [Seleniivibrio woodruffii]TVZ34809.1 3-dehydroquinate dehydratase [Seleniivibrio woodruffii]